MSKKILILETSVTIQKLFTTTLDSDEYNFQFINNGKDFLFKIFDFVPDIALITAEFEGILHFVKIIREISCFKHLAIGMYSNTNSPFVKQASLEAGANSYVAIEPKTILINIDELAQISTAEGIDKSQLLLVKKDMSDAKLFEIASEILSKNRKTEFILKNLVAIQKSISSLEDVVYSFLTLIAGLCEVPVASIYLIENDGPHGYGITSENIPEQEKADFQKVCTTDFEEIYTNSSLSNLSPKFIEKPELLNKFYESNVQLSSYSKEILKSSDGKPFGTVHIVRSGNFTKEQSDFFSYCCKNANILLEQTLIVKSKIFFEQRIRHAFGRFVPEQIIDDLVKSSSENEKVSVGEKREVAILFSDIRSFTNISECNKPEVLVGFLNRYFTTMVEIIKKHGGTVDKFIGDAIMALFGTPVSYEDNARRAVAAAYEMRDALDTLELGDLVMPKGMKFNIGIGIHYGDVIAGSLGSKDKTDYTVIGDNVNLASRLEGLTKTYGIQILVSESVKEDTERLPDAEGQFSFRYMDDVKVKGKAIAVPIYAVDRSQEEFPEYYKDCYSKGMDLYKQGIFNLAKEYFEKALTSVAEDKASKLMISRCEDFIANPPENWDGAITFHTK
ncbi:MAG: guanylate cyclase [Treponema sp.]|nr:guanylate cyclase [Treponema sp.]